MSLSVVIFIEACAADGGRLMLNYRPFLAFGRAETRRRSSLRACSPLLTLPYPTLR